MIEREIVMELGSQPANEILKDIFDEGDILDMEYGYTHEVDHEAPDGYVLELVIRRKCVK